ncbi:TPA: HNH endonuclease [Proteus mirabilis]|uniref:HNH endonuclease n=1 Tax=Proteus mirabilis TaxID=584 RepID=UPI00114001DB|nr:HNH endonuclease signature motif containing protein [Proteus mirabilis]ELA7863519.1 HNH endonuclease [Proteus mirabilis]MBG2893145.1 HNH endonuclease [Proteus mirabilis]MBG2953713.1 HNH endonuclease [Proteus mirabilis]MBG2972753.1 HNH endonuclease [Proteus mirabilis]MBG3026969.1 HNH endonuclease [Proteus mirabilis]
MKKRNVYGGRWAKVRLAFLNENPLCVMCQEQGRITAATVVDHIIPHRLREAIQSGDKALITKAQTLFWDKKNFQSLCDPHHNSTKQRMEKSGKVVGCNADGIPLDPNSHWNK